MVPSLLTFNMLSNIGLLEKILRYLILLQRPLSRTKGLDRGQPVEPVLGPTSRSWRRSCRLLPRMAVTLLPRMAVTEAESTIIHKFNTVKPSVFAYAKILLIKLYLICTNNLLFQ